MDPEPKRVHPYEDREGEAPSSPEGSRESAPEESESDVARESDMAHESDMARGTSDDDEDEVAALRRQVQELRTSLKEMTSRYDRLAALFSSSLTKSTIALTNPTHQTITPTTSCHENRGERSMAEVKNPTIQQIPAAAIETTSTPHPTTTPINVAEGPARQLHQPSTHTPITTTSTAPRAVQAAKPKTQEVRKRVSLRVLEYSKVQIKFVDYNFVNGIRL
ncbi:uncharacterized protein LOC119646520 [Hermetia illucens]|uniref:uncharacterized protein LOC119646520 n=1 Tax=Hermetia illucens TaxID=343691 RepID=UPI0018CC31C4|nr:uncharacterized protein LOC119646520 [Hermetia illucens]